MNTSISTSAKHRVYITHTIPEKAVRMLQEKGIDVVMEDCTGIVPQKQIIKALKKAEKQGKPFTALLTLLTDAIDMSVMEAGPHIRVVSNFAIGYDNIDVATLQSQGVIVTNAPGNYIDTLAEHVVAFTLTLTSRVAEADAYVRAGKYKGWDPMLFIGTDISGKTIGLIGAGHIGERVAHHFARGFNARVIYMDTHPNEIIEKEYGAVRVSTIDELLAQADIVSLHVPLLPSTHHMVDANFLKKMKSTAFLVNTSRGSVVDEAALVYALTQKQIAGAALDVFEFEPKVSKALVKMNRVVLTPHIASASLYAREEMARVAAQNIIDVYEGKTPVGNIVL